MGILLSHPLVALAFVALAVMLAARAWRRRQAMRRQRSTPLAGGLLGAFSALGDKEEEALLLTLEACELPAIRATKAVSRAARRLAQQAIRYGFKDLQPRDQLMSADPWFGSIRAICR